MNRNDGVSKHLIGHEELELLRYNHHASIEHKEQQKEIGGGTLGYAPVPANHDVCAKAGSRACGTNYQQGYRLGAQGSGSLPASQAAPRSQRRRFLA